MFWQTLNLTKKGQSYLNVRRDMNRSVKTIQGQRDSAEFHLTGIIVPAAHTGNSAVLESTRKLQALPSQKMHLTEQKPAAYAKRRIRQLSDIEKRCRNASIQYPKALSSRQASERKAAW